MEEEESGEAQLSFLTDSRAAAPGTLDKETERFRELLLYGRKKVSGGGGGPGAGSAGVQAPAGSAGVLTRTRHLRCRLCGVDVSSRVSEDFLPSVGSVGDVRVQVLLVWQIDEFPVLGPCPRGVQVSGPSEHETEATVSSPVRQEPGGAARRGRADCGEGPGWAQGAACGPWGRVCPARGSCRSSVSTNSESSCLINKRSFRGHLLTG